MSPMHDDKRGNVSVAMWYPEDDTWRAAGVLYEGLADAIATDIGTGRLLPGDRLPTHRALAHRLSVTPGTITRSYRAAAERGLVRGEVGRGTFVLTPSATPGTRLAIPDRGERAIVDLSRNLALADAVPIELRRRVGQAWRDVSPAAAFERQPAAGTISARQTAKCWIPDLGFGDGVDHIVIAAGAQHAILASLAAVTRPGDTIAAAALTYPGLRIAAEFLHLEVVPIDLDYTEGLSARSLSKAAASHNIVALYCIPTLQNPIGTVMSAERRGLIARIATDNAITVIEDDTYRFLAPDSPPPLTAGLGDNGIHITTMSKAVLAGLRVAYVQTGPARAARIATQVMASTWMASPITTDLADRLISDGTADAIVEWKRTEAAARLGVARQMLGHRLADGPASVHGWLPLPPGVRAASLADKTYRNGVLVNPSEEFTPSATAPASIQGIRICLGTPADADTLTAALSTIKRAIHEPDRINP